MTTTAPITETLANAATPFMGRKILRQWKGTGKTEAPLEFITCEAVAVVGGGEKTHMTSLSFIRATEDFEIDGHQVKAGDTAQFTQTHTTCGSVAAYGRRGYGTVRPMPNAEVTCSKCLKRIEG